VEVIMKRRITPRKLQTSLLSKSGDEPLEFSSALKALLAHVSLSKADEGGDSHALAAVDLAVRLDESAEVVHQIVVDAFTHEDVALAEGCARHNYETVAAVWPPQRRSALDNYFQLEVEIQQSIVDAKHEKKTIETRYQNLQKRLTLAANSCLDAAENGQVETLKHNLQRLITLRDLAVRSKFIDSSTAERLTTAYGIDLASAQVCGEIRRMSENAPLKALVRAMTFEPDVPPEYVEVLKVCAAGEARQCLSKAIGAKQAQWRAARVQHRLSSFGYVAQLCQAYVLGQDVVLDRSFARDGHVSEFSNAILGATTRRGLNGDDADAVAMLQSAMGREPVTWVFFAIMRLSAAGRISWMTSSALFMSVVENLLGAKPLPQEGGGYALSGVG